MSRISLSLSVAVVALIASTPVAISAEPKFLTAGQLNAAELLPPPPADGSDQQKAELAELHRIEAARTPEQFARAKADSDNETVTMFAPVLGPSFDIAKLPATAKLFADIAKEESAVTGPAKDFFHRTRPYAADTTLKDCGHDPKKGVQNSYPSGHSTVAFGMGVVLASLVPNHAQEILARSLDFAQNRLVCGVHYRSDIVAGEAFGTAMAIDLMQVPAFRKEYDAASAEMHAAHVVGL